MSNARVWCIVVDGNFKSILGGALCVDLPPNASVYELQKEVIKERPDLNEVASQLNAWKLRNPRPGKEIKSTGYLAKLKRLNEAPEDQDEDDGETAWLVEPEDEISSHFPGQDRRIRVLMQVSAPALEGGQEERAYEAFKDCFIKTSGGTFDDDVLDRNKVLIVDSSPTYKAPKHLQKYQDDLQKRRPVLSQFKRSLSDALGDCFKELYSSNEADDTEFRALEMAHMVVVTLEVNDRLLSGSGWKEIDAHSMLFYLFARYCKETLKDVSFGFGVDEWPFGLVIYDGNRTAQYSPKSDFFVAMQSIPFIIVEVKSKSSTDDRKRMLAQGASVVRLANQVLTEDGSQPNFVLMAIYFDNDATFDRYLLHQIAEKDQRKKDNVYCFKQSFSNNQRDRARLTQQMYNLASRMGEEADTFVKLRNKWKTISSSASSLPSFTSLMPRTKRHREDDSADEPTNKRGRTRGNQRGRFEADGYEHLNSLGLSSLDRIPYVCIVRRLKDGKQLVAKFNDDPEEEEILEFLHTREPPSEHIIPLLGSISSNLGPGILLPLRRPVLALLAQPGEHRGRFLQFAEDLMKGLAFLHRHNVAHRDIKPDNLVYTDAFRLELIDFDVAIRVWGAGQLVEEDVGTDQYKAPEMRDGYGRPQAHSPIRADRWSCGCVILRFVDRSGEQGQGRYEDLECFARRLMNEDPKCRPSLSEWSELSNDKNKGDVKSMAVIPRKRQRVEENDDESGLQTNGFLMAKPLPVVMAH